MLAQYLPPPLPGPTINGARSTPMTHPGGQAGLLSFRQQPGPAAETTIARQYTPKVTQSQPQQPSPTKLQEQPVLPKIPQVDGPSESSEEEDSPSPPPSQPFVSRPSHPSLPQPTTTSIQPPPRDDSEAINSDLDDPDTENEEEAEEGGAGETDIVFCTYDKVARVKNKWKCVLKDGMIHVNGRDYLFAKCTGEFEW